MLEAMSIGWIEAYLREVDLSLPHENGADAAMPRPEQSAEA